MNSTLSKISVTPNPNSGILDKCRKRLNHATRAARVGNEFLQKRLYLFNARQQHSGHHLIRNGQNIRQQLSQSKVKCDELKNSDLKFSTLETEQNPLNQASTTKSKMVQKVSAQDVNKPVQSDKEPLSPDSRTNITGRPIGIMLRNRLESLLRFNFSSVRTHTDTKFAEQVRKSNAEAITVGNHIFFAPGKYNPDSRRGRALLVHELTHVRQQKPLEHTVDQTKLQQFEREAIANETIVLSRKTVQHPHGFQAQINMPATASPLMTVLNAGQNKNQTGHTATPMSASVNRDFDPSESASTDALEAEEVNQHDLTKNADFDEMYYSLKLKLQIEKERMGD